MPLVLSMGKASTLFLFSSGIWIRSIASRAGAHQYFSLSAISPRSNPRPTPPVLTNGFVCFTFLSRPASIARHAVSIAVYVFPLPAPPWHTTMDVLGSHSACMYSFCSSESLSSLVGDKSARRFRVISVTRCSTSAHFLKSGFSERNGGASVAPSPITCGSCPPSFCCRLNGGADAPSPITR